MIFEKVCFLKNVHICSKDHDNGEAENMESDMGQFEDADPEH